VSSGTHIRYIMDQLSVAVQHRISGKSAQQVEVNAATLSENMFLLLNCKVPNPGWSGQRKDDLTLNAESLKCLEMYKFPKTFLDKFAACIRDQIIDRKLGKTTRRSHIDYDKYIPAKNLANGALIICEGDSAMNRILEVGIAKCLNKDDYGVISTGGVPMNARKAVKEIATKNSVYLQRSDQYNNNKFISALVQACNLNYQYTYSETILVNGAMQPNPNYKKEIASLNYRGGIIFIVDQDLDGMGNIMSLILGKFELFWKGLIHFGYCNTFLTPIIRAYPKSGGRVISFYNNEQYNDWVKFGQLPYTSNANTQTTIQPKTRGRGRGKAAPIAHVSNNITNITPLETQQQTPPNLKKYDISYYKGLGTHSREETISMFRAFLSQLYKFFLDEKSNRMFITCFDKQSSLRKEESSHKWNLSEYHVPIICYMYLANMLVIILRES
jgi:DNA gyrase/topoisomerase IV subunit B